MGQEMVVPDWARQGPAQELASLNQLDESLADGIGQSYPVIGYRGKQWSVRVRGTVHNLSTVVNGIVVPIPAIDVVIIGQAKNKSKSFYKKYDPNASGERPICASIDGIVPDADVQVKQHDNCAGCPRNVFRDNPETGRKTRECSDFKRLAVALAPNLTAHLPGGPFMEPFFLRVPPASLNSLAVLGETMEGQGFHFSQYVTRIQFDPGESHPKMVFSAVQKVEGPAAAMVLELRSHANVDRITKGDVVLRQITASPQAAAAQFVAPQPAPIQAAGAIQGQQFTGVQQSPVQSSSPSMGSVPLAGPPIPAQPMTPIQQAWGTTASAPPPQPAATPPSAASPTNVTGFGGAMPAPQPAQPEMVLAPQAASPAPTQQSNGVGDAGVPEAADVDLDKRVAAMMAKMANQ